MLYNLKKLIMNNFIEEQAKKEGVSMKRVWRGFLILCVVWWMLIGFSIIFIAPNIWLIGVIFLVGAGYLGYYLWGKKKDKIIS